MRRKSFARDNVWHTDALPSHFSMVKLHCLNFRIITTFLGVHFLFEPLHDKTNKMACAPSEESDQPGHSPSLIRVFAVRSVGS